MDVIKKGEFLFVVERVKNDKNGNPRYEMLPIWLGENLINMSYELSFLGYRAKKDYSKILVSSYNIDDTINSVYSSCLVKSLAIKKFLNADDIQTLEKYARVDDISDDEEIQIKKRLYPYCTALQCRYKNKIYDIYLRD